ncbi:reverse transcriptase-like protein [Sulfurifustis variabilis]|nr:reverse transcriptase-like protein [Sulfurifustis variabilis]
MNALVDRALARPAPDRIKAVLAAASPTEALIERVRRRAAAKARQGGLRPLAARERLVRALYAAALRPGWHAAWTDASVVERQAAGIGGIVTDGAGRVRLRLRRSAGTLPPFNAEIAAAAALTAAAPRAGITRLRLHTDCRALSELWSRRRSDPRLAPLRAAAHRLERLELRVVPRLHNQTANRLARDGAIGARATGQSPARRVGEID